MLDPNLKGPEQLMAVRELYESTHDHVASSEWPDLVTEDREFRSGNQWTDQDRRALEEEGRPVLTFNIIGAKIDHLVGAMEDTLQCPVVVAVGSEDIATADVLNTIKSNLYTDLCMERNDAIVFERAAECGIGMSDINVDVDPDHPECVKIELDILDDPLEVMWDPASRALDRSDARYVFRSRWLSKSEFAAEYPEHAKDWDKLMNGQYLGPSDSRDIVEEADPGDPDAYRNASTKYYCDLKRKRVRVIRCQYKVMEKMRVIYNEEGVKIREVKADISNIITSLVPGTKSTTIWRDRYYWIDFCGGTILFNDKSPLPFDGFSITALVVAQDTEGFPYGKVRVLISAQKELNKRYSQTLMLLSTQAAPGLIAEMGSVVDEKQAKQSMRTPNGITWLNPNSMAKIQLRQAPQMPDTFQLHEQSMKLIDWLSGVYADDLMAPRGVPESATTASLKYRQSKLSMRPMARSLEIYQMAIMKKILAVVTEGMSDYQISKLLSNSDRYQVSKHVVQDKKTNSIVDLRGMRALHYNVEMRPAENNESQRSTELTILSSLVQAQIPVAPDVLFDTLPVAREKRDRLKDFAQQQAQQQAQAAQQEAQTMQQQMEREFQDKIASRAVDIMKAREQERHNKATEGLTAVSSVQDRSLKEKELEVQTESDDKDRLMEVISTVMQATADAANTSETPVNKENDSD